MVFRLVNEFAREKMSRATVHRVLAACDLQPHRSVYWLNSHDPDFLSKVEDISALYLDAPARRRSGRLVLCADEKTGMQILGRKYPTQPARPGKPEKREFEYVRNGTRCLMTTFNVATGEVVWDLGKTRTASDWAAHLEHVAGHYPEQRGCDWVVDNLNTHLSLEVCRAVARWEGIELEEKELGTMEQRRKFLTDPRHLNVFHFTPVHGSWMNQVELFFSVLARRFLKRGDFADAEDFERRLASWLERYNREQAHPYRWTYTGEPLVRATPFSRTDKQRRAGRAWFGSRPPLFERLLHRPRPYRRKSPASSSVAVGATAPSLAADL